MSASIVEGIQMPVDIHDVHGDSLDFEDTHLPGGHILCVTNTYQHAFTSVEIEAPQRLLDDLH